MKSFGLVAAAAAFCGLVAASSTPTEPDQPHKRESLASVTVSGNAFWTGNTRFYVRGIDYQPGGSSAMLDPLADTQVCMRDIPKFKELGINTIRVYMTDNSVGHDECMNALAEAGIYVILDANNPLYSIHRFEPRASYNAVYLQSVFATIDEFVKYPNTMAFFSGNEVVNENGTSTGAAPYVKAVTRDMRQYIADRKYRAVPVGYSAADVAENRMQLADYMNCGPDNERSDFFAFNDYSWCNSNYQVAGWDQKVKNFTGYGIPIFLSEYGCITNGRDFNEIGALMSANMTGVYSGGLIYEYTYEENKFGIVNINGGQVVERDEFKKLKEAMAKYPAPSGDGGFASTAKVASCPTADASWKVDTTALPPMPEKARAFMSNGAGAGPGLNGPGSQNAGEASPGESGSGKPSSSPGSAAPAASKSGSAAGIGALGPVDQIPFILTGLVCFLTLGGALLL